MLLDLIDLSKLRRAIVYGLVLLVSFALQDLILSRLPVFGVRPLLIPSVVVAVALFEGGLWGGFVGLTAGFFADMGYSDHVVLFTVLLAAAGFFIGTLGKYMLQKGFVSYLVMALAVLAAAAFCQMFRFVFFLDEDARAFHTLYLGYSGAWPAVQTAVVQTLWSLVWAVPAYFPCKLIASRPMGR